MPFYRGAFPEWSRPVDDVVCCAQRDASVEGAGYSLKYIDAGFMYFGVHPVAVLYERLTRDIVGDDRGAVAAGTVTG